MFKTSLLNHLSLVYLPFFHKEKKMHSTTLYFLHSYKFGFLLEEYFYEKLCLYRIFRTIGRFFFFSTRWLRLIIHIDLYKDEVKKNLYKNDDFVYSIPLFCCRFFFLNKIEIIDVLGVVFFLNKAIKVILLLQFRGKMFNIRKKSIFND